MYTVEVELDEVRVPVSLGAWPTFERASRVAINFAKDKYRGHFVHILADGVELIATHNVDD